MYMRIAAWLLSLGVLLGGLITSTEAGMSVEPAGSARQEARTFVRRALVIGNAAYPVTPLRNTLNDATDMAALLRRLGFEVTLLQDATKAAMERAMADFTHEVPAGTMGLVFFAGAGFEIAGVTWLLPIDTDRAAPNTVERAIAVPWLVERMAASGMAVRLLILDTCRDQPKPDDLPPTWHARVSVMPPAVGTLIAYAAGPGQLAVDGTERNSPYTTHLLRALAMPGRTLQAALQHVRTGVAAETNGQQIPWETSSLVEEIIFAR